MLAGLKDAISGLFISSDPDLDIEHNIEHNIVHSTESPITARCQSK